MPYCKRFSTGIWWVLVVLTVSAILSVSCTRPDTVVVEPARASETPANTDRTHDEPTALGKTPTPTVEMPAPEASPAPATPTLPSAPSTANADVTFVRAVQTDEVTWTFHVTVLHPDTGWEDYADGWDVLLPDNTVIQPDPDSPFTRLLLHPHVDEQPFTRSQNQIAIPAEISQVTVRAHDLVDGYGGRQVIVDLTHSSGPDFTVERLADED